VNILLATSEAVPYAKTGGLADVCGALPLELARLGHRPVLVMPAYRQAMWCGVPTQPMGIDFIIPVGSKTVTGHIHESKLPGSDVPVYLVQQDQYFDRAELYRENDKDYVDNCERFVFFSRAVMELIRVLELDVDVIHCNDWQTGLIPAYLNLEYRRLPRYRNIATLLTIHNLAYQGSFWHWDMLLTGLDWRHFNWREMEFYGKLNLMKTGLVFADSLNTVSRRYAEEIQTPEFSFGLQTVLQHRSDVLSGIVNGINCDEWNPATDQYLAANYTVDTVAEGKPLCKAALQKEFGLPQRPDVPLVGVVGRIAHQKGFDLIAEIIPGWAHNNDVQWVLLGTGDPRLEQTFRDYTRQYPDKVAVKIGFCDESAHLIEAGADMFMMPSRFEPCGLNQMYSLQYGTVPVVRETGGLADTVVNATEATLADGTANGFSFRADTGQALGETLWRACQLYQQPDQWHQLVTTGMQQDWSWTRSAQQYAELYYETVRRAQTQA
jgi:starch synthase